MEILANPVCPDCSSSRTVKDGIRYTQRGEIQRFLCQECFKRFSDPNRGLFCKNLPCEAIADNGLSDSRECAEQKEPINSLLEYSMVEVESHGTRENLQTETITEDARVTQYEWKCKKRGLRQNTIDLRKYHLKMLMKAGADLGNPDSVETVLATEEYKTATKWLLVNAYRSYCRAFGIQWEPIRVKYQPPVPYVPSREQCLIFIGGLTRTLSAFCRVLFETGARKNEGNKIEWTDINEENCTIRINHPEKGSEARVVRVSRECIEMLRTRSRRKDAYVFNPKPDACDSSFHRQRKRIAEINGKPEYLKIHFHTFRHARATIDVLDGVPLQQIKYNLGHRSILNTEKYVHWSEQLYNKRDERYYYSSASSDEEAGKLIETGWQHVCNNPNNGHMLFRKAK